MTLTKRFNYSTILGCVLFFNFFIVNLGVVNAQEIPLKFSYLTVDNGLSHTDAKDICQDKLGFIWVATLFGLDRFDGYSIKRYYNSNVPKNNAFKNRVRCLFPEENGKLWLATDGGIQCFDSKTEKYTDYQINLHTVGDNTCTKICRIGNNLMAAIINGKFYLFKIENSHLNNLNIPLPANTRFNNLLFENNSLLYFSTDNGVWFLNNSRKLHHLTLKDKEGNKYDKVTKIINSKQNDILFVIDNNIFDLDEKLTDFKTQTNLGDGIIRIKNCVRLPKTALIKDCTQDDRNYFWIATERGLYYCTNNFSIKRFINNTSFVNSLNNNYLDRLYIDRTGCLWVCTYGGGVNYCDLNAKLFYTIQNNSKASNTLSGNYIRTILEENSEKIWIGTNDNGLNLYNFKTKKFTNYSSTYGPLKLRSDVVNALTFDDQSNLWVGTDRGIDIISKNRKSLLTFSGHNKFPTSVNSLKRDFFGNIWFCTSENELGCIYLNEISKSFEVKYFGFGNFIWADKNKGELFIGSTFGVRRLLINQLGNVIKTYQYSSEHSNNALSSNYSWPIEKQNDSTYWIGTLGGGLNQLIIRPDQSYNIRSFGGNYGIFNDVETIELDTHGNIWMGGNGLDKFNSNNHALVKYDKNDGLQGNSFKVGASAKGLDGNYILGESTD